MKTCGNCKNCVPEDFCGGDCKCCVKEIEVSQDDEIRFYGDKDNEPCKEFATK